jgi:diadenylate cyclase
LTDFFKFFNELSDWRILLDIIVFAAFFYTIYMTLRASGTWKIAVGLSLAALASIIASLLELRGVEWLFANLSQIAFIALLIIFQPEVRRFLEHSIGFGKNSVRGERENLAALLDKSLFDLSFRRWGALIVLPGKNPLKQWLTEGTLLDAHPSHSLLLSIFDPDSPGHDGAIVIENGKVHRFGVRLPLSVSNKLPKQYGTRHHAALGLVEKTDAVVLTVSEERGEVSIFQNGMKTELEKRGDLQDSLLMRKGKELEIFASLVLAVLFWLVVIPSRTDLREALVTVSIEYSRPPANLILSEDRLSEAKLLLQGPAAVLDNLSPSQIRLKVDLSGMAAGHQVVNLTKENIELPKKISVLEIQPANVNLELQNLTLSQLKVKPQLIGDLHEGYAIQDIEIIPALVDVIVPEGDESSQKELLTTPIYLSSIKSSTTVYCKIVAPYGFQPRDKRWPDVSVKIKVTGMKK